MKILKSHITFTNKQRYGIFLLLFIICVLQLVYFFVSRTEVEINLEADTLAVLEAEIDSLKQESAGKEKTKIYPFNPNYITDFKGYTLGMSNEEIDRFHTYRSQGKWINSAEDFQKVTGVSDELLKSISPYFKFPDWVLKQKISGIEDSKVTSRASSSNIKGDLNTVTTQQLQSVYGVGEALATRIIRFRNTFEGGFISDVQLLDVYGLSPEVIKNITSQFTVKTPRNVEKVNINQANIDDLVKIQHIDYPLAQHIIEERTLREGFKSLDDLLKVKNFPVQKIDIIKLYLALN
ncbi:ComEA family DNA-binding protein [Formosa sp. S-31]|uniref:ComEA family DNA-binding protein n=1 Tax=Formosa sp. S-31 TaxID=2790949 RepID=UPI003EBD8DA0